MYCVSVRSVHQCHRVVVILEIFQEHRAKNLPKVIRYRGELRRPQYVTFTRLFYQDIIPSYQI